MKKTGDILNNKRLRYIAERVCIWKSRMNQKLTQSIVDDGYSPDESGF